MVGGEVELDSELLPLDRSLRSCRTLRPHPGSMGKGNSPPARKDAYSPSRGDEIGLGQALELPGGLQSSNDGVQPGPVSFNEEGHKTL